MFIEILWLTAVADNSLKSIGHTKSVRRGFVTKSNLAWGSRLSDFFSKRIFCSISAATYWLAKARRESFLFESTFFRRKATSAWCAVFRPSGRFVRQDNYRVFIKYCLFFRRFWNIPDSGLSLFSLGVSVCTHTRQEENQCCSRTGRVQKKTKF